MRTPAKNLLVLFVLAVVVIYFAQAFPGMQKGLDFPDFYAAARMVRDGSGWELYDPLVQNQYLIRYSGRVGTYFIHPPFEAIVYLPFAMLPIRWAYGLWSVFQAIQLMAVASLMQKYILSRVSWRCLLIACLMFVPVLLDFLQGQDSILILFLLTVAFVRLEQNRPFEAGCLMGCGLFKFHLAFPAAVPSLFIKPKTLMSGFALLTFTLLLVSIGICGWAVIDAYPRFLSHLTALPLVGIHDAQKANLRGLFGLMLPGHEPAAIYLTLFTSVLVMYLTVRSTFLARHEVRSLRLAFANAVFAAVLVGYHLSPHDLTIVLLPMLLLVDYLVSAEHIPTRIRFALLLLLGIFFLPPIHLVLLRLHIYTFACIPILLLFAISCREISRRNARSSSALQVCSMRGA